MANGQQRIAMYHPNEQLWRDPMTTHITSTTPIGAHGWRSNTPLTGGIVVAVDGLQDSVAALETARLISERKDWSVHVVSVLSPFASYPLDDGFDEPQSEVDALRFQLREAALGELLESVEADPGWSTEVLAGSPAPLIAEVAASRQADLLIIGRLHHGRMERSSESVTTLEAMRLSPPVLAVGSWVSATDIYSCRNRLFRCKRGGGARCRRTYGSQRKTISGACGAARGAIGSRPRPAKRWPVPD